jgi:hypothetical protein
MSIYSDRIQRLTVGTLPYDDDEPDAVDLTTLHAADALRRIEFEESCHAY